MAFGGNYVINKYILSYWLFKVHMLNGSRNLLDKKEYLRC